MKKKNLLKKAKPAARMALVMTLCLACVLGLVPKNSYATSYQAYKWTKIDSREEFESFCNGAMKTSDGSLKTGAEYEPGEGATAAKPKSSDWFRVMIVYNCGGTQYFVSGDKTSGKMHQGVAVKMSYGIDLSAENFTTVSGLNTPYIKCAYKDGDNDCYKYYIRFSDNDVLGKKCWAMYCDWYGIAEHAACSCDFSFGHSVDDMQDNAYWYPHQSIKWDGSQVYLFHNISGAADRGWEWHGGGTIECTQDYDEDRFKIYLGVKTTSAVVIDAYYAVEPDSEGGGVVTTWGAGSDTAPYTIKDGVEVVINDGCTLVIDGVTINNGIITVNKGGTLIIRGVMDSAEGLAKGNGSIKVDGGTLIIDKEGTLLSRNDGSTFNFINGAHVEVQGIMQLSTGFTLDYSDMRGDYGSAILIGVTPGTTNSRSTYKMSYVIANKDHYLDEFCSEGVLPQTVVRVKGSGSLITRGIFYLKPFSLFVINNANGDSYVEKDGKGSYSSTADAPYVDVFKSTNIHMKLSDMATF